MSDGGSPGGSSGKKWDWSNPQNILALIGIVAGLAGSVFGVAMAAPFGQDLLCKNFGFACPRVRAIETQFSIAAIDFEGWCEAWLQTMQSEPLPPPGYTGSKADCRLDASVSGPPGFMGSIATSQTDGDQRSSPDGGGVKQTTDVILIGHLSMKHTQTPADTPFSIRADCWRYDPAVSQWVHLDACTLSPPVYGGIDPFGPVESVLQGVDDQNPHQEPDGSYAVTMTKGEMDFIRRWRLDIDGQTTANLTPGDYRVELTVGAPGEAIEPLMLRAVFNVYPSGTQASP